jgi:hypothetical protein
VRHGVPQISRDHLASPQNGLTAKTLNACFNATIMVRPERLFGLRPHPFGVALRAINLAEDGQVVELGLSMSGVRIKTR